MNSDTRTNMSFDLWALVRSLAVVFILAMILGLAFVAGLLLPNLAHG
jgi:hypothetical protein